MQLIKISETERQLVSSFMGEEYPIEIDWNDLMDIVQKIEETATVRIVSKYVLITTKPHDKFVYGNEGDAASKIEAVWLSVVEYIKWKNQNT